MTDEDQIRQRAVATIVKGVAIKTALISVTVALIAAAYSFIRPAGPQWWSIPASILFGSALGLMNFRWLASAVQRVYLRKGATKGISYFAAIILSILKLTIIFIILFIVIKWQLLHVFGLVGGLSLSFLAVLWEGSAAVKQTLLNNRQE
jgi:hypothetical protein